MPCDDHIEFQVCMHWHSLDAIHAFAGDDLDVAVVEPAARALLVDFDSTARHFDVAFESG